MTALDDTGAEKGLTMASATSEMGEIALFGVVNNATLKNIRLIVNNQNKDENNTVAGGICAVANGTTTIENSYCGISNISCSGEAVGGICGRVASGSTVIKGCKVAQIASNGVKGTDVRNIYIGGVLGHVANGASALIQDSYCSAKIVQTSDEADFMGGICGGNSGKLSIVNCYTTAPFGYPSSVTDYTLAQALSGYLLGGDDSSYGEITITDCFYLKPGGKKAQAKNTNGAVTMKEGSWPAWNTETTSWSSVGAYSANGSVYPTLDWE